jgi:hypothetical protein
VFVRPARRGRPEGPGEAGEESVSGIEESFSPASPSPAPAATPPPPHPAHAPPLGSIDLIDWRAVGTTAPLIAATVLFSVLHIPINVPALCETLGARADVDHEFMVNGAANAFTGICLGGLQSYMVYATSALYHRSGGGGRASGLAVAVLVMAVAVCADDALAYVPRCLAGVLSLHLGLDLLLEALWKARSVLDPYEHVQVFAVVLCCQCLGLLQGLGIALSLACAGFIAGMSASSKSVVEKLPPAGLRSKTLRSKHHHAALDELLEAHVSACRVRTSGLFFGNARELLVHTSRELCLGSTDESSDGVPAGPINTFVLDMTAVNYADSTAVEALGNLCVDCARGGIVVLVAGLRKRLLTKCRRAGCLRSADKRAMSFHTLDAACAYAEQRVLGLSGAPPARSHNDTVSIHDALLHLCDGDGLAADRTAATRIATYLERRALPAGAEVWTAGDAPTETCWLESGVLGVPKRLNPRLRVPTVRFSFTGEQHDYSDLVEMTVPGQQSGELGFFTGDPRKFTLVAVRPSVVWVLTADAFERMRQEDPHMCWVLQGVALRYASHRLRMMATGGVHSV